MTLSVSALDEAFSIVRLRAGSVARTRTGTGSTPTIPQSPRKAVDEKESPAVPAFFQGGGQRTSESDNDRREDPGRDAPEGRGKIDPDRDEGQRERGPNARVRTRPVFWAL